MTTTDYDPKDPITFGWTDDEAEGAIPNGTRVIKVEGSDEGAIKLGTRGRILGSVNHPELGYAYFVEWDTMKMLPVFVVGWKIAIEQ